MEDNIEAEIARGLQESRRDAWLQLYDAYAETIWRNVSRLVGSDSSAVADIMQEAFLAAACSARHYKPDQGSLWIWLWTITRRQVALYYRKQKRNSTVSQAQDWWAGLDGQKSGWIDARADMPPDVLQSEELATLVRLTLSKLSPDYQTLLLAKYIDGQSGSKIAELMGCSETAVRSKLVRARRAFRKVFKKITGSKSAGCELLL